MNFQPQYVGDELGPNFYLALGRKSSRGWEEASYVGYQRVPIPRSHEGWEDKRRGVVNTQEIAFPACAGGREVITDVAMFMENGEMFCSWRLTVTLMVETTRQPVFAAGTFRL